MKIVYFTLFVVMLALSPGTSQRSGSGRARQSHWRGQNPAQTAQAADYEDERHGGSRNQNSGFGGDLVDETEEIQQSVVDENAEHFGGLIAAQQKQRPPTLKPRGDQPEVRTSKGTFRGKFITSGSGKKVAAFYGVPFAKKPVGNLKFRKPEPSQQSNALFEATELPNACIQDVISSFGGFEGETMWNPNTNISDDCLYLNLWVPQSVYEKREKELVNILFWIHGGGFFSGSNSIDVYNGATLASEEDVIVVSAQYRLGPLGFLYFGTDDAPGNMGLWDLNLALLWVNENIQAFGGDSNSVTIFGESAGSAIVGWNLLSVKSKPLFKRAVMMSGLPTQSYSSVDPNVLIQRSYQLAELAGCDPSKSVKEITACLRIVEPLVLTRLQWKLYKRMLEFPFVPTIDGDFIKDNPINTIRNGEAKRAELLIGTVQDEGSYFLLYQYLKYFHHDKPSNVNRDRFVEILRDVFQNLNFDQQDAIINYYMNWENPDDGEGNRQRLVDALGDGLFVCPNRGFADDWSNRGLKVFYYHFTQRSTPQPWAKWMGVMHGDEIPFVFGRPLNVSSNLPYTDKEKLLSSLMMRLIANFAKIGTPSDNWERYSTEMPVYLDLNATAALDSTSEDKLGPRANHCVFWNKILPQIGNNNVGTPPPHHYHYMEHGNVDHGHHAQFCPTQFPVNRASVEGGVHGGRGFHHVNTGRNFQQNACHNVPTTNFDQVPQGVPKHVGQNLPVFGSGGLNSQQPCNSCCVEQITPPPV